MEQPPIEPRALSVTRLHEHENEHEIENEHTNEIESSVENESSIETPSLLILSDVFLDRSDVFDRLKALFTKYKEDACPPSFLFCGDFVSSNFSMDSTGIHRLLRLFTSLAELIASFPRLVEFSDFIFIPGPRDVGTNGLFPREPVGNHITELLLRFPNSSRILSKKYFVNIQIMFTSQAIQVEFV